MIPALRYEVPVRVSVKRCDKPARSDVEKVEKPWAVGEKARLRE